MQKKLCALVLLAVFCFAMFTVSASAAETVNVTTVEALQSAHPYANNMDTTWVYTHPTDASGLNVTFSSDTATESGCDYIYIYDGSDTEIGQFSGTSLAGKTVLVTGNTVKIRLTSDGSSTNYGFRVTEITKVPAILPAITPEAFTEGDGTESDPYRITTAAHLTYLAQSVNGGTSYAGKYFLMTADISLNDLPADEGIRLWTPIGTYNRPFRGSFDGGNHTVSGLYINSMSDYQGLFGYVNGASFQNLTVADSFFRGDSYVGALVGYATGYVTFTNCTNSSEVTATSYAGGIVGYCDSTATFTGCRNSGSISAASYAGGIVGRTASNSVIENCINTWSMPSTLARTSSASYIGGIVGHASYTTVRNCYNTGSFYGYMQIGGIAGYMSGGSMTACYTLGSVSGLRKNNSDPASYIGAVVGQSYNKAQITDCYYLGGYAFDDRGNLQNGIGSSNCASPAADTAGSTTAGNEIRLQEMSTFTGFDFTSVWTMEGSLGYLYPELQSVTYPGGGFTPVLTFVAQAPVITQQPVSIDCQQNGYGVVSVDAQSPDGGTLSYRWYVSDTENEAGTLIPGAENAYFIPPTTVSGTKYYYVTVTNNNAYMFNAPTTEMTSARAKVTVSGTAAAGGSVWNGTAAEGFAGGTGAENDPYLIATAEQLAYLAKTVNEGNSYAGKYFVLVADISLNDTSPASWTGTAQKWTPVGTYTSDTENAPFSGSFDGNGHTVRGLYIYALKGTTVWYGYQGLFGYTYNASLKNVSIDTAELTAASYVGALVGYAKFNSSVTADYAISRCSVSNAHIIGETNIGGLAGSVNTYVSGGTFQNNTRLTVSVSDCTVENCSVLGEGNVGGIVGQMNGSSYDNAYSHTAYTFTNCKKLGGSVSVTGGSYAGGVVAYCGYFVTFTNCTNTGDVSASSYDYSYAGGIAGRCYSSATFTGCTNSGNISATAANYSSYAGGIVGYCGTSSSSVSYTATFIGCTNNGDVSASSSYAGGIAGYCYNSATFSDCTNSGDITSDDYAGGVVGRCVFSATFTDCTNSGEVTVVSSGDKYAGGIVGYCDSSATFTNCSNFGDVSAFTQYWASNAGGIAGYCKYSATFTNCTNSGTISASSKASSISDSSNAGGIAGYCNSSYSATFTDCTNSGDVSASNTSVYYYAGGIAVYAKNVIRCSNTGKVSGCGIVYSLSSFGTIEYCYNTGEVGESGIVGAVGESSSIEYCYNTGSNPVPATDYSNVSKRGGIVGSLTSSTVRNCFNTGAFYGNQYVGGIVGYAYGGELKLEAYILYCYNLGCVNGMAKQSDSTVTPASCIGSVAGWANPFTQVTSCYYTENTAISDDGAVQGGIGTEDCTVPSADRAGCVELRTHGQMQQQTTFAGYDFTSVWTMEGSSAYPYPELITPAMDGAPAVPSPVLLTEIVSPASVTGIPHGMKWEETFSSLTGIKDHLPATVTLKLSDGSTREVPVTWTCDDYVQYPDDKMKPYSYAAIGTLRLPAGVANPQNLPLTTGVAFTVDAFVLSVKSVNSTSASVLNGTAFADMALPETVRVRFNDDTEERLSVVWTAPDLSVYNPSLDTVQRFTVYGTVTLPEGVQDPLALAGTASVSVTVQEKKYYTLNSMYYEKTGTYENGTAVTDFGLPASVTLNCSSYGSIEMKVTWDTASCGYDPASKEKQVLAIKGSVNLPDYILDPNGLAGKIVFTATVKAMPYVTMVDTASSVTNVLNGTLLKDMELPETVYISLSTGYGKYASVEWDLDRSYDYDPQKKVSQGFYVYGTAILPEGVYNKTNIPLDTSCYVSVSGAASVYLESVNTPSPSKITVPNGTDLSTVELPTTTKIRLNTWVYKEVSIVWDLANCGYDPGKTSSQTLTIKGQIQLPDNIPNIADVSTEVRITVVVQSLTASGPYVRSSPSLSHTKYNIENGTELTADLLPSVWTVSISDVTGKYPSSSKFPITWNLESVPYDPTNPHMQHITVSGKIQLPDDVANPNNYSMNVTAHLWFDASTESGSNVAALTKPTNVTFESGIVSWTASEHAQGYEVTLYRVADEGLEVILTVNADETQYDFSSVLGMDSYMATVIAIGDGVHYSNSVAAYSKFYTPVPLISAVPPAITAQPASASYILGSQAAPLTVTAFSPEGVVSYRWYESPDGTTGMGMPIDNPSEDPSKYTPDVSTVGTRYYYVVVTCTNDAATGEKTADTVSEVAAVTVTNGTGYSVSGKVSSSGDGEVTVQLIQNGVVCYETKAPSNGTYLITGVAAGEYTLRVSKDKHVTRDYTVTVGKP